jgi:uncharacterized protein
MAPSKSSSISVRLTPRADRNGLVRFDAGVLHARVSAPPVEGAANTALVELLSDALDVRKSAIIIVSGSSSREKRVEIHDLLQEDLEKRVQSAILRRRT